MRFLARASLFLTFVAGCAPAATTATGPAPVAMPEQPAPAEAPAEEEAPAPAPSPAAAPAGPTDDPKTFLNGAWSATFQHKVKYSDAIKNMHSARTAYVVAATPIFAAGAGVPSVTDFETASSLLDQLNRRSAAAYYAPDATSEQSIAVLDEISTMLLRWSQRLDELGLAKTPASYRTSGKIALTFEELTHGPAKRWRGEGLTLANLCVQRAKADGVATSAARACDTLLKTYTTPATPPHSKTRPECACNPGDPLCSASMSGWCKPGK